MKKPRKTKAGTLLREARMRKGLVLAEVEAATGVRSGGICQFENGRSLPELLTAYILCEFYGLSLDKLAGAVLVDER